MNYWNLRDGTTVNEAIRQLPVAYKLDVDAVDAVTGDRVRAENFRAILVNGKVIDVPTDQYVLKQHEEAFRPVINGLSVSGVQDFQYAIWNNDRKASMAIFVGQAQDGVKFGFRAGNSFDRTSYMTYKADATQKETHVEIVEKEHVTVWGFRQVCSNGMVIKVPLKSTKYLDAVQVSTIKTLMQKVVEIRHMGSQVDKKLQDVQYIVEAFLLLKGPLDMMIIDAQGHPLTMDDAEELIKRYVGRRRLDAILEQFGREEQTLWGLVNAVTFLASHSEKKLSMGVREKMLDRAGTMMEEQLLLPIGGQ